MWFSNIPWTGFDTSLEDRQVSVLTELEVIDGHTDPDNQTGPPAGCSSSTSAGAVRVSPVEVTSDATAKDVLPTQEACVGQNGRKMDQD